MLHLYTLQWSSPDKTPSTARKKNHMTIDAQKMKYIKPIACLLSILWCAFFSGQQQEVKELEGVVIKKIQNKYKNKRDNPAYAIMQEVWKRKKKNALDKWDSYSFEEYEKIQYNIANIDPNFLEGKLFEDIAFVKAYTDTLTHSRPSLPVYLNEAIYHHFVQNNPTKRKKKLMIAQKSSGFEDNELVRRAGQNLYREINLYDNVINYFDMGFQSPVGENAFSTYDFAITDTLQYRGHKTFIIQFSPRLKEALAFEGNLYISAEEYSVLRATLRSPTKMGVNFVNRIFTVIEYDNPDESTFLPQKLSTSIALSPFSKNQKKSRKSFIVTRTVSYNQYQFNIPLTEDQLTEKEQEQHKNFYTHHEDFWKLNRHDSLSVQEKGIYEMLGRLEQTPKFKSIVRATELLSTGYYNVGNAIDIGYLYSLYDYNSIEGHRLRLSARTYFGQNDMWRVQGIVSYGFKDQKIKYAMEGRFMFHKKNRLMLGYGHRHSLRQLGAQLTTDDAIMRSTFATSSVFGTGENSSLSWVTQHNLFAAIDPVRNLTIRLDAHHQKITAAMPKQFDIRFYDPKGNIQSQLKDSHLTLSLIARPGAKFAKTGIDRSESRTLAPTIVLKYTRGFEGVLGSNVAYNKLQFLFNQPFLVGTFGKSFLGLEMGKTFDPVPIPLQNAIPGNQSYGIRKYAFAQLNFYEFIASSYITAHWEHHLNGKLFSLLPLIKKLNLREVLITKAAYGTLSDEAKAMNLSGDKYRAPERNIYYEYGFGIENIGIGNLRIFRMDFNWRGNYLHLPNSPKFGIKFGIQYAY